MEDNTTMKVLLCEPGKKARITTVINSLESLQKMVGGYIEAVYPYEDLVAIVCNEEGKLMGLDLNRALKDEAGNIYDIIAGPFLVVGCGEENFCSLSKEYIEKYGALFEHPETFYRIGDKIEAVKILVPEATKTTKHR